MLFEDAAWFQSCLVQIRNILLRTIWSLESQHLLLERAGLLWALAEALGDIHVSSSRLLQLSRNEALAGAL